MDGYKNLGDDATNVGLNSRAALFNTGAEVEMLGRLHADLFHQNRSLPANLPLKVKLTPSKDKFVLVTGDAIADATPQVNYKLKILEARLYVHTFELTKALAMAQEESMMHANLRYPIKRVALKHLTIPANQSSALHDNIYWDNYRLVLSLVSYRMQQ